MILHIDSANPEILAISLEDPSGPRGSLSVPANHAQAEKLLPLVEKLLAANKIALTDLASIRVAAAGQGFTSLRIGVATANALAYALGIPVVPETGRALKKRGIAVASPAYAKPPSIGKKTVL